MDRVEKICGYLDKCVTLADVGCDHGYCTRRMLATGMCERAVISDISLKCLAKAEKLLIRYIENGSVTSVCCNGLEKIDTDTEQVLIAGMGGEEIISILQSGFIPKKFVLQPMRNTRKLREFLVGKGAHILKDEIFKSGGKFYYIIKGEKSGVGSRYSPAELEFGKNLNSEVLKEFIATEINKKRGYLQSAVNAAAREKLTAEIIFYEEVLKSETC